MDTSENDGREMESVVLPSAPVQSESTAEGDAAVLTPHSQPQLTSAPSLQTGVNLCTAVWVCHSQLTKNSIALFIRASTIDTLIVRLTEGGS